jgi:hypothetical protein
VLYSRGEFTFYKKIQNISEVLSQNETVLQYVSETPIRGGYFQQMTEIGSDRPVDWSCETRLKKLFVPVLFLIFRIRIRNIFTISTRMPERTWTDNDNRSDMFRGVKCAHVETALQTHVSMKCDSDQNKRLVPYLVIYYCLILRVSKYALYYFLSFSVF